MNKRSRPNERPLLQNCGLISCFLYRRLVALHSNLASRHYCILISSNTQFSPFLFWLFSFCLLQHTRQPMWPGPTRQLMHLFSFLRFNSRKILKCWPLRNCIHTRPGLQPFSLHPICSRRQHYLLRCHRSIQLRISLLFHSSNGGFSPEVIFLRFPSL